MISLHVYLDPKADQEHQLESAIRDKWMTAMADQPGFLRAALLKPLSERELQEVEAKVPEPAYELVAFWSSESERRAWTQRPIHDEVFSQVQAVAEGISYTLQNVEEGWSL